MSAGRIPTTANSPLTTKGDLFTYSTSPARLAVGANGEQIVADSSTSTGLRYNANFAAGKNKIINGDFNINQRTFSSTTTDGTYGFDRWLFGRSGDGTTTCSAQTFTPGTAPVSGYEAANYVRIVTTGQTTSSSYTLLTQRVEDVRTLAGQTVTVSFWAKANTGTPSITVELQQNYGTGGTATSDLYKSKIAITTSWARYSVTIALNSLTGKTIGTGSNLAIALWVSAGSNFNSRLDSLGLQANTFEFWGVQVEAGSVATAFQTATGTIQGELAACQRYYYQWSAANAYSPFGVGFTQGTTLAILYKAMPVVMRTTPTITTTGTAANYAVMNGNTGRIACSAVPVINQGNPDGLILDWAATGLTAGGAIEGNANNTTAAYVGFSAEL